jgi:hypothetical protein
MTNNDIIDLTNGKSQRYKINICHFCDHDKYPTGKPIDPTTDIHAQQTVKGGWKCGVCSAEVL